MNVQLSSLTKPLPPKLPASQAEFLSQRKLRTRRTLNDMVEEIHLSLVETQQYVDFLFAVYDEQAVEGSLAADNFKAAEMIRERAKKIGSELEREKLATIVKALNTVLRRYGCSRKERRHMIGGQVLEGDGGGD